MAGTVARGKARPSRGGEPPRLLWSLRQSRGGSGKSAGEGRTHPAAALVGAESLLADLMEEAAFLGPLPCCQP